MIGTTWGTGQVLLDMLWFFLLLIEIWLMITVFIDIFRRHDMRGWVKAFWVLAVIVVPLIGILLYLILYGNEMRVHAMQAVSDQQQAFRSVGNATGMVSPAEELSRLAAELRSNGIITDDEFDRLKTRIING